MEQQGQSLMITLSGWQIDSHWGKYFIFVSLGWLSVAYFRFDAERMLSQTIVHASGFENLIRHTDESLTSNRMIQLMKEGVSEYVDAQPGEGLDIYARHQFEDSDDMSTM